jgi:cytochrome c-type biogenesis protein CcmE
MSPLEFVATVLVMEVSAAAILGIAGRQRDRRRFLREVSVQTVPQRGLSATRASLNAHRMVGIRDTVGLHRATGQLHFRVNALAVQPRWQVEHHGLAPSLNRNKPLLIVAF